MPTARSIFSIFVVIISAFVYSRAGVLSLMYINTPGRIRTANNLKDLEIKYADVVRNCEDAVLDTDAGFALLSCDPGRDDWNTVMGTFNNATSPPGTGIYIWHYASSSSRPSKLKLLDFEEQLADFHPLGLDFQPASNTMSVINHAETGSRVDIFQLSSSEATATYLRSLEHPLLAAPNSVLAFTDTEYLITNDHYFLKRNGPILPVLETYLGIPGGSVVYVRYDSDRTTSPPLVQTMARLNFANGIALLNESTIAVASSGLASVRLYTIERSTDTGMLAWTLARSIDVPFHPDNLSVDGDGKLLIAGHPHAPSLEEVAKNAARCNGASDGPQEDCQRKSPSGIMEWSEAGGLVDLYFDSDYQSSSTALRDAGRRTGLAVGLYEKGIMTWTA